MQKAFEEKKSFFFAQRKSFSLLPYPYVIRRIHKLFHPFTNFQDRKKSENKLDICVCVYVHVHAM